ncbi:uncharacterized protein LOC121320388 [Polyodon spathula]|uniref:uncharacterized protein LOC121320388 n=1 Tax=Polyodon spathula TaxID=7913 RepID=UPI001B7DC851|nr:uncharacterized protein LOC121320388 [Polyodon spathula]
MVQRALYHHSYIPQPAMGLPQQPLYYSQPDHHAVIYQVPPNQLQQGLYQQPSARQPAFYLPPYQDPLNRTGSLPASFQPLQEPYIQCHVQEKNSSLQAPADLTHFGLRHVATLLPGSAAAPLLPGGTQTIKLEVPGAAFESQAAALKPRTPAPSIITASVLPHGILPRFLRIQGQCFEQQGSPVWDSDLSEFASLLSAVKDSSSSSECALEDLNKTSQLREDGPECPKPEFKVKKEAAADLNVKEPREELVRDARPLTGTAEVTSLEEAMKIFLCEPDLGKAMRCREHAFPASTGATALREPENQVHLLKTVPSGTASRAAPEEEVCLGGLFKIPGAAEPGRQMEFFYEVDNLGWFCDFQIFGRPVSLEGMERQGAGPENVV